MLHAKQAGVRGPSKEIFNKKFYMLSKLGYGAPAKRFSTRKSTSKAGWGKIIFVKYCFCPTPF
ncbi:nitrogen fixation protein NifR [Staphylococcus haemolyticus]|nr:nitrogen fixation protein NifR [Staphylococcus haemolyticus]PTK68616.1 nitrogen fixation protein NifR [Staphylococcus haemolyticus]PTL02252.1 nitrogen fixation protein NifR [Staphylococcus haemolyticus]